MSAHASDVTTSSEPRSRSDHEVAIDSVSRFPGETEPYVTINVASRLSQFATTQPDQIAVAAARSDRQSGRASFVTRTFADLDRRSDELAAGLAAAGFSPGMRVALLVPCGVEFVELVFAMLKARLVMILIDPGMGREHLVSCLAESRPEGFIGVPKAQLARWIYRAKFPQATRFVTVRNTAAGDDAVTKWIPTFGLTLDQLRERVQASPQANNGTGTPATGAASVGTEATGTTASRTAGDRGTASPGRWADETAPDDPAAIIFTTGSTGPPKGVLYTHRVFDAQVRQIRDRLAIEPGSVDVAGFPLFALFDAAMGVTCVLPAMDFTRPASVDPEHFLDVCEAWQATQSFGSPALWNTVLRHAAKSRRRVATLTKTLSAGAPVPPRVLEGLRTVMAPGGEAYTPYGATEALPVAVISASEVLDETAERWAEGAGTCVGTRFEDALWKVIAITDEPLATMDRCQELPPGKVGELIVSGPQVTREYVTRPENNPLHKIHDNGRVWHRMGDVGYLDEHDRFWFCGRKAHRVETPLGTLYSICAEAIANQDERIYRSALVGVGPRPRQKAALVIETWPEHHPKNAHEQERLETAILQRVQSEPSTRQISHVLWKKELPTDIRHNSKIFREKLAIWVQGKLSW